MTPRDAGDDTMNTVRGRYEAYSADNPRPRGPSALRVPVMGDAAERMVGTALGAGAGVLLLVLSLTAAYAASTWREIGRDGAVVAYTITAFFLGLAGLGALLGTWNHLFRVLPGEAHHH